MNKQFDENARKLKASEVTVTEALDSKIFTIRGSKGNNAYTVDLNKGTCTCPDFTYRCAGIGASCKHIIACRQRAAVVGVVVA